MIYRCSNCNEELTLMKGARYCPLCGHDIKPIDLEEKVSNLYNSGKTLKEIASELHITDIILDQVLAKAVINEHIPADKLIQTEYKDDIEAVITGEWDGKLKTIKTNVPDDCSYTTINYYVKLYRNNILGEKIDDIRSMIKRGVDITEISEQTGASTYVIERVLVEEIEKDKAIANPYINNDYKAKILEIAGSPEWDGKLRSIKKEMPEEVTYINIKATLAKNK